MTTDLRPKRRYVLPDALRPEFAKPFGPVLQSTELKEALNGTAVIVAVGDVVSLTLKILGITPRLFVCDYKTQRGAAGLPKGAATHEGNLYEAELGSWGDVAFTVRNPAGVITRQAWDAISIGMEHEKGPVRILVEGEEDMLGVPCFLEAPIGAVVLYGMPNQGVVFVKVTKEFQARVAALLSQFKQE